jgi:hypothetical protein
VALYVACTAATLVAGVTNAQTVSGPTVADGCMQTTFGTPVNNSNKLNCTANDIALSRAVSVEPNSCIRGQTFDLLATFEVNVTADGRYDAGFFFRTDGGTNARGDGVNASGQCTLSALTPPPPNNDPVRQLDGDSCGDLNASPKNDPHEVTFLIPDVLCAAAPGTNVLRLPNCTSWHSNQGTACSISSPDFLASDADDFHPDTKSKCVCDDTFTVPVTVEDATLTVVKSANPTSVPEPGAEVSFTVQITNDAEFEDVEIDSIIDNVFGDLGATPSQYDPNTCPDLIGDTLGPGDTVSCSFEALVTGNDTDQHKDTVTVTATQPSTGDQISDSDDATVDITGIFTEPEVSKDAKATANCQLDASYEAVITNPMASVDTLTVDKIEDDRFGDVTQAHAAGGGFAEVVTGCGLPQDPLNPGQSYTCAFVGRITSASCDFSHTNTVTATVTDDDGATSTPSDDATVSVDATP